MTSEPSEFPHEIPVWEIMESLRSSKPTARQAVEFRPGDRVAVHFLFRGRDEHGFFRQNELVWLTVLGPCDHGHMGALEKNPVHSRALRAGDTVEFEMPQVSLIQRAPRPGGSTKPRLRSRVHRLTRSRRAVCNERL